ncbi:hypothetical protein K505DRAFT_338314 [Melanomma pulvis-pyrius CBS 109.77]|uniref:CCHC-type domain-containing protein n=1 Tax=Melanomma pulvis-pyrius CBS 109.77 TaxID=1314802 RepID=A0A6A6X8M5_9PLEO|nr:hypothetical protein K505DRAFT_338314 [Melanomma pulvis-pyrius CBS 109.77]
MSRTLRVTLPDGTSFALPPERDVYPCHPMLCADFPGYGMRPEDERCIRCGKEEGLPHRENFRSCSRDCFLCGTRAHIGRPCPELTSTVNPWWWRLRGYVGNKMEIVFPAHLHPPAIPIGPCPSLISAPPAIMSRALESIMSPADQATVQTRLQAAEQMCVAANKLIHDVGDAIRGLPYSLLEEDLIEGIVQTALLSSTLYRESNHMLRLVTEQLQHTINQALVDRRQAYDSQGIWGYSEKRTGGTWAYVSHGVHITSSASGAAGPGSWIQTAPSISRGQGELNPNADVAMLSNGTRMKSPGSLGAPSFRFDDNGNLQMVQVQVQNTTPEPSSPTSREGIQSHYSSLLSMLHDRPPLPLDGDVKLGKEQRNEAENSDTENDETNHPNLAKDTESATDKLFETETAEIAVREEQLDLDWEDSIVKKEIGDDAEDYVKTTPRHEAQDHPGLTKN